MGSPANAVTNTSAPAEYAVAITTSDATDLAKPCRGIYVGTGGNIVAIVDGTAVTFVGAAAGTILPIRATRVNATNTTASNLVALY